jgi:hypothetical protein
MEHRSHRHGKAGLEFSFFRAGILGHFSRPAFHCKENILFFQIPSSIRLNLV